MTGLAKQFLDDVVMFLRPVKALFQLPAIDDVADKIQRLASRVFQEMEQRLGTSAMAAKMCVRNPDGPVILNAQPFRPPKTKLPIAEFRED